MKITLRERELKNGNKSLVLDIYHEGKRRVEFLGLYLIPEIDDEARECNKNAIKRANKIKADYTLHPEKLTMKKVNDKAIKPAFPNIKKLTDWLDQYEALMFASGVSKSIMTQVYRANRLIREYLKYIKRDNILLKSIDRWFVSGYLAWLKNEHVNGNWKSGDKGLSDASLHQYQMRFNCVLNRAVREGMLKANPFYTLNKYERYPVPPNNREFLTKDELVRFLTVETDGKNTQRAFGFACFTGLRLSDMEQLRWRDIRLIGENMFVYLTQQKTGEQIAIPLGKMAQQYLPIRGEATGEDKVFNLPTRTAIICSCKWIAKKAGINKNVSFHTSRHTFATLTLEACKDIKMVSKLLGHKSVLTTQVYAEVQMASKYDAVSQLNGNFGRKRSAI